MGLFLRFEAVLAAFETIFMLLKINVL